MQEKEKLKIVYRPVSELIPYARNARTHSDKQITQIAASIKEFGFTSPILLDGDNGILAGHGRLEAAKKLKLKTVPTIDLVGLTEAQKRAYVLADNRIALESGWDFDYLVNELKDLKESDFDIDLTGFDETEVNNLLGSVDEIDDSFFPDSITEGTKKDLFQVNFLFPVSEKDKVQSYIKKVGKQAIIDEILSKALADD